MSGLSDAEPSLLEILTAELLDLDSEQLVDMIEEAVAEEVRNALAARAEQIAQQIEAAKALLPVSHLHDGPHVHGAWEYDRCAAIARGFA